MIGPWWWLLGGVVAGIVVAVWVVRQRPDARFDETAVWGGLAGVLAGAAFSGLATISGGDLGVEHLVGVGPRLLELLVMSVGVLGISGLLAGLVIGLLRLRATLRKQRQASSDNVDDDETEAHHTAEDAED